MFAGYYRKGNEYKICDLQPNSLRIKGALHLNAMFPPLDMAGNISFTFQGIQKRYHHPVNLCCGVFCEFLGDFFGIFGR